MSDRLTTAVRRLLGTPEPPTSEAGAPARTNTRDQLERLEREMGDVRTRVTALFFAVIAANFGEILARFITP